MTQTLHKLCTSTVLTVMPIFLLLCVCLYPKHNGSGHGAGILYVATSNSQEQSGVTRSTFPVDD